MEISDLSGRLTVWRLVGTTWSLMGAHRRMAGGVWLAATALYVLGAMFQSEEASAFSPQFVLESVVIAMLTLGLVRTLLGVSPAWRLNRGGAVLVAADFASSCAITLWWMSSDWFHFPVTATPEAYMANYIAWFPQTGAWILAGMGVWWFAIRSALWIYDQAADRTEVSLAESWRGTRGAVWAVYLATSLLAILPSEMTRMLIEVLDLQAKGGVARTLGTVLQSVGDGWFCVAVSSVPAALYRLRGGMRGGGLLAEVFD